MQTIFTISGVRGIYGKDLTPQNVLSYAGKFSKYLQKKDIAVGRDTRFSGIILLHSAITGLLATGHNVYDFGICPTPAIVMLVRKMNLAGGIQITASHNPPEWNGLKFISPAGRFFFESEIREFKKQFSKNIDLASDYRNYPQLFKKNIIEEYLQNIVMSKYFTKITNKKFKIGVDSCNGAAEESAVKLVKMLGSVPISINALSSGFPRPAEPKSENLRKLSAAIKKQRLDFGIAFDPDGDRFACVDELGIPLSEESSILLAITYVLSQKKGSVVVNNSTTMAVDDICHKYKVKLYRSKTGEANVVEKMQEVNALIGGEGNGGVIFPEINNSRDGLVATAIVVNLLSRTKKPLSIIRKNLPQYYMQKLAIKKYNDNWSKLIRTYFKTSNTIKFDTLDGLKVIGDNFWILIRQSNTEPILRIIAESNNNRLTNSLMQETLKQIKT